MSLGSLLVIKLNKVASETFLDSSYYLFCRFNLSSNLTSTVIVLGSSDINYSLSICTKMMIVFTLSDYDFEVLIFISIFLSVTEHNFIYFFFEIGSVSVVYSSLESSWSSHSHVLGYGLPCLLCLISVYGKT